MSNNLTKPTDFPKSTTYFKPKLIVVAGSRRIAAGYMTFLQHKVLGEKIDWEYAHDLFRFAGKKADVLLLDGWYNHNHLDELRLRIEIGDLTDKTKEYEKWVQIYLEND